MSTGTLCLLCIPRSWSVNIWLSRAPTIYRPLCWVLWMAQFHVHCFLWSLQYPCELGNAGVIVIILHRWRQAQEQGLPRSDSCTEQWTHLSPWAVQSNESDVHMWKVISRRINFPGHSSPQLKERREATRNHQARSSTQVQILALTLGVMWLWSSYSTSLYPSCIS